MNTTITRTAGTHVQIPVRDGMLAGDLNIPGGATGIVIFAHGSGSGRHSPRNQLVAEALGNAGLATLLPDLLTEAEEQEDELTGALRFDIGFLTSRLVDVIHWVAAQAETRGLEIGLFGASTGAAAAIAAAAMEAGHVHAVVSRGGRPDLAGRVLSLVSAPTLLIVGGDDVHVLALNRDAYARMRCEKRLAVVPGATHLFEEPGTLEAVAGYAGAWFSSHFSVRPSQASVDGMAIPERSLPA
ncbi:MAG TPA: dienelactone hydrolase family protein [Gemmatimonadaceae bacterium]|nr:dienelactone hydrolase family protein [Gemmatimonadaceae bacterium]